MNKNLSQNAAIFWKYSGETLLTKHQARGTLLSQQSLAMSKHTIFIGKQGEETQQEIFFGEDIFLIFLFFVRSWEEQSLGQKLLLWWLIKDQKDFRASKTQTRGLTYGIFE